LKRRRSANTTRFVTAEKRRVRLIRIEGEIGADQQPGCSTPSWLALAHELGGIRDRGDRRRHEGTTLIGKWSMTAVFEGLPPVDVGARITFAWMPGKKFLLQR
jgi:hypothetical protein